jgi:hypothetical protein
MGIHRRIGAIHGPCSIRCRQTTVPMNDLSQDREGRFEPILIPEYERRFTGFEHSNSTPSQISGEAHVPMSS